MTVLPPTVCQFDSAGPLSRPTTVA